VLATIQKQNKRDDRTGVLGDAEQNDLAEETIGPELHELIVQHGPFIIMNIIRDTKEKVIGAINRHKLLGVLGDRDEALPGRGPRSLVRILKCLVLAFCQGFTSLSEIERHTFVLVRCLLLFHVCCCYFLAHVACRSLPWQGLRDST